VARAVALVRRHLEAKQRIDLVLDPGAGEIDVDVPQLQGALLNVLRNAEEAMEAPGVILVRTESGGGA
jgi:signal transduction histidine kinase